MRLILVLLASIFMFASPVYATGNGGGGHLNNNCRVSGNSDNNTVCSDVTDNSTTNNTTNNGGVDNSIDNSTTVNGGIDNSTTNRTTNNIDDSINNTATGGTSIAGAGVFGSGNSDNTNTNTATGGEGGAGGEGGTGVGVGIGEGGDGGSAIVTDLSRTTATGGDSDVDVDSNNTNIVGGGTAISGGGEGGDATAVNGGNTLIIGGGGQGECYEGECEGGSGTLNSNADASVGDTSATGGNATNGDQNTNVNVNIGEDGPLTASSQSVDASASVAEGAVQIDNSSGDYNYKEAVRTAATSFSSICTSGAGAQGNSYGISVAVTSTQCSYLMQADAYMALGDTDNTLKYVNKAARSASIKGFMSNIRTVITLGIL